MEAERAVHVRDEVAGPGARVRARGQVEVGAMREQDVLHPEGRPRARPDRAHKAREALGASAEEPRHDRRAACVAPAAQARRAERRGLLGRDDPVAALAKRGEDRARVPVPVRLGALDRPQAVEDQRHRLRRRVVCRVGVAKPGRVRGELREVRVAAGIDGPVGPEEGVAGKLVENEQHQVRAAGCGSRGRGARVDPRRRKLRGRGWRGRRPTLAGRVRGGGRKPKNDYGGEAGVGAAGGRRASA